MVSVLSRLIELCGIVSTVVVDLDGIYEEMSNRNDQHQGSTRCASCSEDHIMQYRDHEIHGTRSVVVGMYSMYLYA